MGSALMYLECFSVNALEFWTSHAFTFGTFVVYADVDRSQRVDEADIKREALQGRKNRYDSSFTLVLTSPLAYPLLLLSLIILFSSHSSPPSFVSASPSARL